MQTTGPSNRAEVSEEKMNIPSWFPQIYSVELIPSKARPENPLSLKAKVSHPPPHVTDAKSHCPRSIDRQARALLLGADGQRHGLRSWGETTLPTLPHPTQDSRKLLGLKESSLPVMKLV